jgi:cytochrome c553
LAEELSEQDVNDLAEYYGALLPQGAPTSSGDESGLVNIHRVTVARSAA